MSQPKEGELVEQITKALLNRQGLAPQLRSAVLRLPRARRKEACTRLAVLSLSLLAEDPEQWRVAILTIGDLLHLIEASFQTDYGEPGPTRH